MKLTQFIGRREWGLAFIALVAIVVQVYFDLRLPDYMQDITQIIVMPDAQVSDVLEQGAYMLGCALGSMAAAVVTGFAMAMIGATLSRNMRAAVFDQSMEFSMEEYNKFGAEIMMRDIAEREAALRLERLHIDAYYQEHGENPPGNKFPKRK